MSIFDNIVFDEYSLLEGQQAEEYKKKKEDEKIEGMKKDIKRMNSYKSSRNSDGSMPEHLNDHNYASIHQVDKNNAYKRRDNAGKAAVKLGKGERVSKLPEGEWHGMRDSVRAVDAIDRHQRRHAKHESVIAMIEAYECEYSY